MSGVGAFLWEHHACLFLLARLPCHGHVAHGMRHVLYDKVTFFTAYENVVVDVDRRFMAMLTVKHVVRWREHD
jgi:hypothetical protein